MLCVSRGEGHASRPEPASEGAATDGSVRRDRVGDPTACLSHGYLSRARLAPGGAPERTGAQERATGRAPTAGLDPSKRMLAAPEQVCITREA